MTTNRVLIGLVLATLIMQAAILYNQNRQNNARSLRAKSDPISRPAKGVFVDLAGLQIRGNTDSDLALVEFSDYECPFCARHATGVGQELDSEFIKTGKLRHAFANNPLPIHPNATLLATAAICSGEQGRYWEMHDVLFKVKPKSRSEIIALVPTLSLDISRFGQCLEGDSKAANQIATDANQAKNLGLTQTPAFALGRVDVSGRVAVEIFIVGAVPLQVFQKAINESLEKSGGPR